MCHDVESRPPQLENPAALARSGLIELTGDRGTSFAAWEAVPKQNDGVKIIILPDVRGIHPYYAALAERFAQSGHAAVVVDYYGRTAGPGSRAAGFDWRPHFAKVSPANVATDVAAAAAHLDRVTAGPSFVVGFCFGGGQAWRLAASDIGLAGVVGFYGLPGAARDVVDRIHLPMLLLLAGADVATSAAEFADFTPDLTSAGVSFEQYTYAGAPTHSSMGNMTCGAMRARTPGAER